ncbi:MAG: hypothetical protein M1301_02815 [Candidatus Thermoplasmatota archaeon]|nr:hypothetical protein [Candidatus Thermoplasmatota archaeon]
MIGKDDSMQISLLSEPVLGEEKQWTIFSSSVSIYPVVTIKTRESLLESVIPHYDCRDDRSTIILYNFGYEATARAAAGKCKNATLLEIGNIDRAIIGDSRHAANLGDQLASEIFADSMKFRNLDVFIIGASNIFLSDRKGFNMRFTEQFWNSFISAVNTINNDSRLIMFSKRGNTEVEKLLISLSNAVISVDIVNDNLDFQITGL